MRTTGTPRVATATARRTIEVGQDFPLRQGESSSGSIVQLAAVGIPSPPHSVSPVDAGALRPARFGNRLVPSVLAAP